MKWAVYHCDEGEERVDFFRTEEEALAKANESRKLAESLVPDLEGKYPGWVWDVSVMRVMHEMRDSPDGLVIVPVKEER